MVQSGTKRLLRLLASNLFLRYFKIVPNNVNARARVSIDFNGNYDGQTKSRIQAVKNHINLNILKLKTEYIIISKGIYIKNCD